MFPSLSDVLAIALVGALLALVTYSLARTNPPDCKPTPSASATVILDYLPDFTGHAAIRAVMCDVQPPGRGVEYPFHDLDSSDDDDDEYAESVYAYFVFVREDDK